jgi:hypothetical protein
MLLLLHWKCTENRCPIRGHFTHETECPWPFHMKHSHWWKRRSRSKFTSHLRLRDQQSMWMQDGCKVYMDSYMASNGLCFHGPLDYFQKPLLGGRLNTKLGDHDTPNPHNRWFILFYHVWGAVWIEIHWNSIWLRAQSHTTLEGPWPHYMILEVSWDNLWALTTSWSRLLDHVWSGP